MSKMLYNSSISFFNSNIFTRLLLKRGGAVRRERGKEDGCGRLHHGCWGDGRPWHYKHHPGVIIIIIIINLFLKPCKTANDFRDTNRLKSSCRDSRADILRAGKIFRERCVWDCSWREPASWAEATILDTPVRSRRSFLRCSVQTSWRRTRSSWTDWLLPGPKLNTTRACKCLTIPYKFFAFRMRPHLPRFASCWISSPSAEWRLDKR